MKIGIITFWESTDNYGQVLQAYALQQVLKNMGHEPFQIRYSLKASQGSSQKITLQKMMFKLLKVYPIIQAIKEKKERREDAACRALIESKNIERQFSDFRKNHISQSEKIYNSYEDLKANFPKADCYITGSDQVWTMLLNNEGNKAYFLDFGEANIKKVAYAASFAMKEYPQELMPLLRIQLAKFNAISVREDDGIEICRQAGRSDAIKTIDPTFLLNKDTYCKLAKSITVPRDGYIFTYSINIRHSDELAWNDVCNYAHQLNLRLVTVTSSGNFPGREILSDTKYVYSTIPEWIAYINSAKLIITTSFHGVAFSIILNKPFVYFPLSGKNEKGNGRVISLLNEVGLMNRICTGKGIEHILKNDIDWNIVNRLVDVMKKKSMDFLYKSINN